MDNATRVSNPPRIYFLTLSELRNRSNMVMSPAAGARRARMKPLDFQGRATSSISQQVPESNPPEGGSPWKMRTTKRTQEGGSQGFQFKVDSEAEWKQG